VNQKTNQKLKQSILVDHAKMTSSQFCIKHCSKRQKIESDGKVEMVIKIQRATRHWLSMKKIHCLNELASAVSRDTLVGPEPSREELDQKATLQSASFRELPSELWIEIYSFAPSLQDVSAMAQSCGLLYSVSQINLTWMPTLAHHFPKVFKEVEESGKDFSEVNWKNLLIENSLVLKAFNVVTATMLEKKLLFFLLFLCAIIHNIC
jgi:hypothetical protein